MPVLDKSSKNFNIEGISDDFTARASIIFSGLAAAPVSEFAVPQPPDLLRDQSPVNRSSMPERSQTARSRPESHTRSDRRRRQHTRRSSERSLTSWGGDTRSQHQRNPQQWSRHDLSDVDITFNNRQIAIDFRNSSQVNSAPVAPSSEQPTTDSVNFKLKFSRPRNTVPETSNSVEKNRSGYGNLTMPEYQVGVTKPKRAKKAASSEQNDRQIEKEAEREEEELYQAAKANIYLDHLLDDEDEEDEGNC